MMRTAALLMMFAAACTTTPSGATCPTSDAPGYDDFAKPFMATYCQGCHSRTASDRHGAPSTQNYDTLDDLVAHAKDIDEAAAAGPNATNTMMPDLSGPVHTAPSKNDRVLLGQFLACQQK